MAYVLTDGDKVVFSTDSREEMFARMFVLSAQNHEAFVDMILTVNGKVKPKTLFMM